MASLDPAHILRGHSSPVQSLAFLSEGKLYAGDSNGELRLWDLESCRTEYTARLHDANAGIMHIAYLPGSGVLASQGRDGCVKLWAAGLTSALDRALPLLEIRTESFNFCRCAVWSPGGGGTAAAATQVRAGQQPASAPAPSGDLRGVQVACAAHDPADVGIWVPMEAPAASVILRQGNGSEPKHGMCMALAFLASPGSAVPSESAPRPLPAADTPDPQSTSAEGCPADGSGDAGLSAGRQSSACGLLGLSRTVSAAAASADPRFILAGYEDGTVALWDLRMPAGPLGSVRAHGEPVMCMDVRQATTGRARREAARRDAHAPGGDTDGNTAGCGGGGGTTVSYDLVSGSADEKVSCCVVRPGDARPVALAHQLRLREPGTADVRIRGDGKLFACGCWDGRVRLYSLRKREPLAVLKYHRDQATALAFSPQTNMLASASRDTTIAVWSVYASAPHR